MFTKEQIKELKNLDVIQHFDTVLNSEYKRGTFKSTDEKVMEIYNKATGSSEIRNLNCKICVYNLYRDAGLLYRESVDYYKNENMKKAREAKQKKENEQ